MAGEDRLEHRAIALALRGIELVGNALGRGDAADPGIPRRLGAGGMRPGGKHESGHRQRQRSGHADKSPISNCRSFQASAFAAGFSIRKRG